MSQSLSELYGVHYFLTDQKTTFSSSGDQLYFFTSYIGAHSIKVALGDCVYYFDEALKSACVKKGPCELESAHLATVVRGYMHPDAQHALAGVTTLPYVNGCSTKQLLPPLRPGDPTLQYLKMPPNSHEQQHHVHSTFRVVLILEGEGKSVVGLGENATARELKPGMVCIFEPMSPHHFETTTSSGLVALPLHIFSSVGAGEHNHPMFNGTIKV